MNGLFVLAFAGALAGWFALSCTIAQVIGRASSTTYHEED